MEFRKMLMITLYAEQKKRHRFIEQSLIILNKSLHNDLARLQIGHTHTIFFKSHKLKNK